MPETFEFTGEMTKLCIGRDPPMERKETHCDLLDTILRKKGPFFNKSEFRPPRKGWVITPHPDVASGRYQQAEFAADLSQVYRKGGVEEYRDPREFFRRTF